MNLPCSKLKSVSAIVIAGILLANATSVFAVSFSLHNHPDGSAAQPYYGLRLDGLWTGNEEDVYTFDFDHKDSSMMLDLSKASNGTYNIEISGVTYGGQDGGSTYVNNKFLGLYDVKFTYTDVSLSNGTYYAKEGSGRRSRSRPGAQVLSNCAPILCRL